MFANVAAGRIIKRVGVATFTVLATASNCLFWLGAASSYRLALLGAAVGCLGHARTLGATTLLTAEGSRLGMPQGRLSGDRANLIAVLKVRVLHACARGRTAKLVRDQFQFQPPICWLTD